MRTPDVALASRAYALARVAVGAALVTAPSVLGQPWLGRAVRRPAVRDVVRLVGVRDGVIGAGLHMAYRSGDPVRPWLFACMLADGADTVVGARALLRNRSPAAAAVTLSAVGGCLVAAALLRAERKRGGSTPTPTPGAVSPGGSA